MNPVVHFEMPADDNKRVSEFYSNVFGWKMNEMGPEMGNYVVAQTDETDEQGMLKKTNRINGGFYKRGEAGTTSHVVIAVEDLDKQMEAVKSAGGKIEGAPMDIPTIGRFVMFLDTEGNRVGMLQPTEMM